MKNDIKNIKGVFAGKLKRAAFTKDGKRRIVIDAKDLHALLNLKINYHLFYQLVIQSPLRENIDYQYSNNSKMLLTISAAQAIFVMSNTQHSWQLHHAMTDLIQNNFAN